MADSERQRFSWIRPLCAFLIIVAAVSVALMRVAGRTSPRAAIIGQLVPLDGAALKGSPQARVGMVEYADFQCAYCAAFARSTLSMLDELYVGRGQLMIAFRHLPLEAIHPMAFQAAQAAECANQQGKFWTIHNWLFRQGRNLSSEVIGELARSAGLAKDVMDQCLPAARIRVQQDIHSAQALGLRATPAFLLGEVQGRHVKVDQVLFGNVQIGEFTVTIDRLLHQASAAHVGARP